VQPTPSEIDLTPTLSDLAFDRLKREILECTLAPGSEITERQLAERYGSSKAPLREALVRLEHEGLVRAVPRSGYIIKPVTLQDVDEVFELRLMLEPSGARRAAGNLSKTQASSLELLSRKGYTPANKESERAFLAANRAFHVGIAMAAGNIRLANVVGHLLDEMERFFYLGLPVRDRSDEMQQEHSMLVAALVDADAETSERLVIEQITAARKMVLDGILSAPWIRELPISR
jgi:DNA-binding GntR family transcriptional regulator